MGTSLSGTGTPLTSWLNGATGYVTVWYDQSGAGHHATQTYSEYQPIIDTVNRRVDFMAQNGMAFFNLPDGTVPQQVYYTVTTKHGDFGRCIHGPNGHPSWLCGGGHDNTANCFSYICQQGYSNIWYSNDLATSVAYAPGNTVTFQYDGSSRYGYVNGAEMAGWEYGIKQSWNGQIGNEFIGKGADGDYSFDGQLYYLHIFKSSLSASDRAIVEGSISPTGDCAQRPLRATHPMICLMHPFNCNPRIAKP